MLALAAGLGVLMGIILMLLPGIAAPVVPAFGLMNGSTFAAYDTVKQVVLPDAGCALRYGGGQNEVIRFMHSCRTQNPVHEPETLEAAESALVLTGPLARTAFLHRHDARAFVDVLSAICRQIVDKNRVCLYPLLTPFFHP